MRKIKIIGLILLLLIVTGCNKSYGLENNNKKIIVDFIDVGQGDAIYVRFPNNESMLIDAGESYKADIVVDYLKKKGVDVIDYLIGTHPHTDHIGGFSDILNNFEVLNIYMPKVSSNSKTFEELLLNIKSKNLKVKSARNGVNILKEDDLDVSFIGPVNSEYTDLNNYSSVVKIKYLDNSFLFMGDAEIISEKEITADLDADVIKVGHHGSDSSSSQEFVEKVKPKYAVIMVGVDNIYDHPSDVVVNRYEKLGSKVLRTDLNGNISCYGDGVEVKCHSDKNIESKDVESSISLREDIPIVNKGDNVTIKVQGVANTLYDIDVIYSSGVSKAKGLEDKYSNELGEVDFTFKVSSNVKAGIYDVKIKGGNSSNTFKLEVR